jgi:hydroxymethylpyrimidine pyrophosphatase-like HAD family hydrolase
MFKEAGLKIAVKNSNSKVLEAANIITDENYKSGFGKAIYEHIL